MDVVLKYRGRMILESDLAIIRALIEQNSTASRRELSRKLCEAWNWVQPNGALCDMVCRGAMLALERAGHIALPPVKWRPPNPLAVRPKPKRFEIDTTPIECSLKDLGLEFRLVRRTPEEPLFNGLIEEHHYLHYTQPVGEQLKYIVFAGDRPVACLAWSSAARHLGPRDRFIGWSRDARRRNIRFIAYNSRFLVLPWVRISCLASTFWVGWRRWFRGIGSAFMGIPFTTWKLLSTPSGREPVIGRRTGSRWDGRPAAEKHPIVTAPIARSSKCWDIRSTSTSGVYWSVCECRQD